MIDNVPLGIPNRDPRGTMTIMESEDRNSSLCIPIVLRLPGLRATKSGSFGSSIRWRRPRGDRRRWRALRRSDARHKPVCSDGLRI